MSDGSSSLSPKVRRDKALAGFLEQLTEVGKRVVTLLDMMIEQEKDDNDQRARRR